MNINEVKELIKLINDSDLAYFEYESGDSRIKMDKSLTRNTESTPNKEASKEPKIQRTYKETEVEKVIKEEVKKEEKKDESKEVLGTIITSPMVGTFYESPSPDSESFVKLGDNVKKGQTLCIIEAMKLMNEIESDVSGEVIEILVKDGDMVESGTPLFKIKEGA